MTRGDTRFKDNLPPSDQTPKPRSLLTRYTFPSLLPFLTDPWFLYHFYIVIPSLVTGRCDPGETLRAQCTGLEAEEVRGTWAPGTVLSSHRTWEGGHLCVQTIRTLFFVHVGFFFLKDLRSEMIIIHFGNEGSKISILLSLPGISKICTHSFSQQTKEWLYCKPSTMPFAEGMKTNKV